jgi:Stage II sporulation protein E (SpoIIE)
MHKVLRLALIPLFVSAAFGQSADVSSAGGPATINASWRFHTGDDFQWASPGFDDSQWPLIRLDQTWAQQGYKGYYGYAWYRFKVKLPATRSPLALGFTEINSADEIYADGQLIGSIGKMRPAPVWLAYVGVPQPFPLPVALNGKTIQLAIRVWQPKESATNYPFVGRSHNPYVGHRESIDHLSQLAILQYAISIAPDWIVSAVAAAIGFFSIGLFLLRRRSTEYAWAALFLFCDGAQTVGSWCYRAFFWPALDWILASNCIEAAMMIFWLLFIWRFLRAPTDNLLRAGIILLLLAPIPSALAVPGYLWISYANLVWIIVPLAVGTLVCARLVRLAFAGNREAQLLLLPFLLSNVMTAFIQFLRFLYYAAAINTYPLVYVYRGRLFSITWDNLSSLIAYLAVAALLMMRFTHSAERDERLSREIEAARAVQQVIIPEAIPSVPGFNLEGVYKPAAEVGGDFFQIIATPRGGVLVVIGDVSGKGMPAAMTVSLLVGTVRTLAHYTQSPAQILSAMNNRMLGRHEGGFTTCLVLCADPSGSITAANAGHLAPYLDGNELTIENGFPLGLDPHAAYPETQFPVPPGAQLTLLSDGVIEARAKSGELFGFERTAAVSTEPAEKIAQAAQQHGQEDDITVLTLTLVPAAVAHA